MSETCLNYEAVPYAPVADPAGKLRSGSLFLASAGGAGRELLRSLHELLRSRLGQDRVVYGYKVRAGEPYWEFYFYRHAGAGLEPSSVARLLRPAVELPQAADSVPEHFMWSFEVGLETLAGGKVGEVHYYRGTERNRRRFGESFVSSPSGWLKENEYAFYDAAEDQGPLERALRQALGVPAGESPSDLLPAGSMECVRVCLARKPVRGILPASPNGLYFSGIRIGSLLSFLERSGHPADWVEFVESSRGKLDHLLYDVGFDFEAGTRPLRWVKAGVYGIF